MLGLQDSKNFACIVSVQFCESSQSSTVFSSPERIIPKRGPLTLFPAYFLQPTSASMDLHSYRKNTNNNQLRNVKWFDTGLKNVKSKHFVKKKKKEKEKPVKDVLA